MKIAKDSVIKISKIPKIVIFMMFTGLVGCDQNNEASKAKSENEQVVEYIKMLNTVQDAVMVKNLTTNIKNGQGDFSFIRLSKYNDHVICEKVSGNLTYHLRQSNNDSLIQVDKYEPKSINCGVPAPAVTPNEQNTQVRIYGFVCNKDGELWERRREKIDVTQAVFIDGKLVHCTPDKNDSAIFDSGSYLMGREGYFVIDGVKYPRSEIFDRWDKTQLNL
ncbi:hypothetical protein LW059_004506 [Salmonella enterica]|nr:hypothetical protein [Salmonella enterica subsp. enterica serovar Senftenberg]EIL1839697.1 hypothetical protein [Salmonella enterica]EIL7441931.1 hypothetical protein [Salmonella enterica]EIL8919935.1 hypothetical protein [Salmonella enterica]EIL8929175.1 hypothetical protein [Salmonella enterica]